MDVSGKRRRRGADAERSARLEAKARWVWEQTLLIHRRAPETRVASSLSAVELFTALFYAPVLAFDPANPRWSGRDRLVVSKGHGSVCLYPILADCGFFPLAELDRVGQEGSFLGGIPDPVIPGYETVNGSLGHGPGVACGMAYALRDTAPDRSVFVVTGDAELQEGAVWEAAMFAGHHGLDNLVLVVDNNQTGMLGHTRDILRSEPMEARFAAFGWDTARLDGHHVAALAAELERLKGTRAGKPKLLVADTVKGRGVPNLENHPLSHILTVKPEVIDQLVLHRPPEAAP